MSEEVSRLTLAWADRVRGNLSLALAREVRANLSAELAERHGDLERALTEFMDNFTVSVNRTHQR